MDLQKEQIYIELLKVFAMSTLLKYFELWNLFFYRLSTSNGVANAFNQSNTTRGNEKLLTIFSIFK